MVKLYKVSPSPHLHSGQSTSIIMRDVLIALIPSLLVSIWFFGISALYISVISVAACMISEYMICRYLLRKEATLQDGSAAVTGLLLAFNVPTQIPEWILITGALFAIGIAKMSFGGLGNNPFNPALAGRVFLLISFPVQMTSWPVPKGITTSFTDAVTGPTPLAILREGVESGIPVGNILSDIPSLSSLFLGHRGGSLGEISALALLVGFGYLLHKKIITWHIPIFVLGSLVLCTGMAWIIRPDLYASPVFHLFTGGALLGAIYMATDYATSPMSVQGMILYGISIGCITAVIRLFGAYPEGMSFAILIMNAFVPLINLYLKPKRFGREVSHG